MPKTPKWNGQWHPFAERFPMLSEQELRDMAASIAETGQLHPCVMNSEGLGLDGRNRVAACRIAGLDPTWTVNDGNPMSIIIAANVHHRFLTTGQRAMAVAVELEAKGMREKGRWKRGSVPDPGDTVKSHSMWIDTIKRCGVILDHRPDLADSILGGDPLDAAYQQAKTEKDHREGEEAETRKRRERSGALPNDLAALVDSGVRDLDDAEREAEARKVVTGVDAVRNGDGAPPPSFGDRVQDGTLTWPEAQTLAEEWKQERDQSISRYRESLLAVVDHWPAVPDVADHPGHPYFQAIVDGLDEVRQKKLHQIIERLRDKDAA